MSQWWEYPALPRRPGERAILKAKAICAGGRTGRLAKPGEFHIKLSSATQSRSGVQWRPMPTLFHLHLRGKTEKPGRQRCLRFLPITPTSLSFPEGAGQEPSSFSVGPRQRLQLRGAPTLLALTWTFAPIPTSAPAPPAMDSAARDKMQPALPPGMSPSGWAEGGMVARKMGMVGLVLPARSGWSSIGRAGRGVDCPGGQAEG